MSYINIVNLWGVLKLKQEIAITDKVAMSIRGLWHIDSLEEKKKIIKYYDGLYHLFSHIDNHPELFTNEDLNKLKKKRDSLSQKEKDLISEIFIALHMGFITEPMDYSIEEVKDFYSKGLYFTKDELEEMIEYQFSKKTENHNSELILFLNDLLEKHLFFDTIEEAEEVWNKYFT